MKIGIIDNKFFALQGQLIKEGHDLFVYVDGMPKTEPFHPPTEVDGPGTVTQVMALTDMKDCDFIITADADRLGMGVFVKRMFPDTPMIYYSYDALLLEDDRSYAHNLIMQYGIMENTILRLPFMRSFSSRAELQEYLDDCNESVVIKRNFHSTPTDETMRTIIAHEGYQVPDVNAWFDKDGLGGCTVEEYIPGMEAAFGMFFNGEKFVGLPYVCMEHKGACDGDRGGVLTGEVGTTLTYLDYATDAGKGIIAIFKALEPMMADLGLCGMVDFNTKVTDNHLYFMEFTMRFGRPTLECQIAAHNRAGVEFGDTLYSVATGGEAYKLEGVHTIGVTAYSYGLPVLTNLGAAHPNIDLRPFIPGYGSTYSGLEYLSKDDKYRIEALTLMNNYNWDEEAYVIRDEERHFIVTASTINYDRQLDKIAWVYLVTCVYNALENLENENDFVGVTWRSDVGKQQCALLEQVSRLWGLK